MMIETFHETVTDVRWYAVQSRPRQEQRAASNLVSSGLTTFLPMIRQVTRRGAPSTEPLFPSYLFVQCDIYASAHSIRYTRGVAKVLSTSGGPAPIDDSIVESIRGRMGKDGFVQLADTLTAGDSVQIMCGPLKGLTGIFQSAMSGTERVMLLLESVQSQIRVMVDTASIRKVDRPPQLATMATT
jgi:transcriptional antiterminator RfaH